MASRVRVLPAVIAVSIGALAFKSVDIAQAVAEAVDAPDATAQTAGEGESIPGLTSAAEGESDPDAPRVAEGAPAGSEVCLPSIDYAAETGLSQSEIQVLRSLADRRTALDEREAGIDMREQAAAAAELRLNDQIAELKALEASVQGVLDQIQGKKDERLDSLVKTYEAMKAKDAARIFDTMEDETLLKLAQRMKSAPLGAVMAAMSSTRAQTLTRMLAELGETPVTEGAKPAAKPAAQGSPG